MSATYSEHPMAGYRDAVVERLEAGDAFGEVERDIDDIDELDEDQRAALWLFAFAKRDTARRRPLPRAHLTVTT